MNLVPYNDPILYTPTVPFDFSTQDAEETFNALKTALLKFRGYGLTANQIGMPFSVFVFGNGESEDSIFPAFNPKIIHASDEHDSMEEGCLSIPGLIVKMSRSSTVRVRYTTHKNVTDTIKLEGLSARVFQHEMCHIAGRPFFDGAGKVKMEMAVKKCAKMTGRKYSAAELLRF